MRELKNVRIEYISLDHESIFPDSKITILERGTAHMLETQKYVRKQFSIDAVQISERNMADVAAWSGGSIETDDKGKRYIKVEVSRPANPRQSQGFVGDWVLYSSSGSGFKVYTQKAFRSSFEQLSVETTLHDVTPKSAVVETVTVVEKTVVDPTPTTLVPPPPPQDIPGVTPEQQRAFQQKLAEGNPLQPSSTTS